MIESYSFGRIVIDGVEYTSDVIVHPDRVDSSWWRKSGHELCDGDIRGKWNEKPQVLVVGTGAYGYMNILPSAREFLAGESIALFSGQTDSACRKYNDLVKEGKRVAACLHLTC